MPRTVELHKLVDRCGGYTSLQVNCESTGKIQVLSNCVDKDDGNTIHIYMYICVYVHIYVYMYVCLYIFFVYILEICYYI